MAPEERPSKVAQAHSVFVRLALPPYTIHFKSPTYLQPTTLDLLDKKVCKEALKSTAQDTSVREAIGTDAKFWSELVALLKAALPSLEQRSFKDWDPSSAEYENTSGAHIAKHYPGLWRDLERLNDLVSISRNVLTAGAAAQDLAAVHSLDGEVFRLINCCVRVTARGYDGDATPGEEDKWQLIVNAYKKLLITSLQFLNNLVAQNERRKLMLWVSLFDNNAGDAGIDNGSRDQQMNQERQQSPSETQPQTPAPARIKPTAPVSNHDILLAYGTDGSGRHLSPLELEGAQPLHKDAGFKTPHPNAIAAKKSLEPNGYVYFCHCHKDDLVKEFESVYGRGPMLAEIHLNLPWYWYEEGKKRGKGGKEQMWRAWQGAYEEALAEYRKELDIFEGRVDPPKAALKAVDPPVMHEQEHVKTLQDQDPAFVEQRIHDLEVQLAERYRAESANTASLHPPTHTLGGDFSLPQNDALEGPVAGTDVDDMRMPFTAEAGTKILESGKAELMKRLEGYGHGHEGLEGVALQYSRSVDGVKPGKLPAIRLRGPPERTRSMSRSRSPPVSNLDGDSRNLVNGGQRRNLSDPVMGRRRRSQHDLDVEEAFAEDSLDEEEDEEEDESEEGEEEEEEEEDYPGSTEDGRGLLTDVPLILGPSEIEVLPMLIMSGIVPPNEGHKHASNGNIGKGGSLADPEDVKPSLPNTHTVRTHLLLSQTPGRNLLRELLIFVAAWDLREEELYFKFMVKIMEAILKNGLMPYAYHAFRDRSRSKDIISPAQAVIMKLLTTIFRGRGGEAKVVAGNGEHADKWAVTKQHPEAPSLPLAAPSRVDLHILNFIFTEFRQHIIPQTCALIFLQGQIHKGRASPEDFPLNLWDMERMYEGVYQYLEFFAVLTEEPQREAHAAAAAAGGTAAGDKVKITLVLEGENGFVEEKFSWKKILAEWEMASELVTLLRELEGGIPKVGPQAAAVQQVPRRMTSAQPALPAPQRSLSADEATTDYYYAPGAVERPFDLDSPDQTLPPLPLQPPTNRIFEAETPLAYPEDPLSAAGAAALNTHDLQHGQDEPSDFEWRNLKKLTVLVLSSLIWKNRLVQDQVRSFGGLEALVGCCRADEHNPNIREHAIMCLRFAVEGNEDNAAVIRRMAAEKGEAQAQRLQELSKQQQQQEAQILKGGSVTLDSDVATRQQEVEEVPREVLDNKYYETFTDPKGQIGLRRKDTAGHGQTASSTSTSSTAPPQPAATTSTSSSSSAGAFIKPRLNATKMTAEKAAELMQNALRDLPLGDKLVTDKQKAEALARLDRAFESTEKALGKVPSTGAGKKG